MLRCDPSTDVLFVIDLQERLLGRIDRAEAVCRRVAFLARVARLLAVPIIATEQAPKGLGPTASIIAEALGGAKPLAKSSFSCMGDANVREILSGLGRTRAVLVGIETHICVCGTALDLIESGYRVVVCPDAVSSRSQEAHKLGMERIRDHGGVAAHTESVTYEWIGDSTHPDFGEVLKLVKAHPL